MKHYTQLTQCQRYQIHALLQAGGTQTEIAHFIGVHKSTVSRELTRNRGRRGYRPIQAQGKAEQRRREKIRPHIPAEVWVQVRQLLRQDWSPQQVSEYLRLRHGICVSHERIYQQVREDRRRGGSLYRHLRCQKSRRKKYGTGLQRRGRLPGRVGIEQRPAVVEKRARVGDWEVDTIHISGSREVLVSLVERKTRLILLAKTARRGAQEVARAVVDTLKPIALHVHTITSDNGKEFALHEEIASQLDAKFYFARPYTSWERGANENANGLVRQYIPKKGTTRKVSKRLVKKVMDKLNRRPRKCLDFKTPYEVFFGTNLPVALTS